MVRFQNDDLFYLCKEREAVIRSGFSAMTLWFYVVPNNIKLCLFLIKYYYNQNLLTIETMLLKLSLFISILSSSQIEAALRGTTSSHFFDDAERKLAETKISGECTVANFAASVGGKANLASLLKTNNNDAIMQGVLDTKCANSLKPSM